MIFLLFALGEFAIQFIRKMEVQDTCSIASVPIEVQFSLQLFLWGILAWLD